MYCRICGAENKDGAAFCKECGAPIGKATGDVARAGTAVIAAEATSNNSPKKTGSRKPLIVGGTAAAVVIAAAAGFGIYKVFFEPYPINEETFPDQAFRSYVSDTFDVDKNGELSRDEANSVEYIGKWDNDTMSYNEPVSGIDITSFEGIGYFRNLKGLVANENYVSELDLSKNKQLEYVVVNDVTLSTLDASGCSKLHDVWVNTDATVTGLSGDMLTAHLVTGAKASLTGSDERELAFDYALDGRLVQSEQFSGGGSTSSDTTYAYDDNGRLTQAKCSFPYGSSTDTYEYDSKNQSMTVTTEEDGSSTKINVYSYDDDGRIASYTLHDGLAEYAFHYTYDESGLLSHVKIEQKHEQLGSVNGDAEFKYDDNGNMLSAHVTTKDMPTLGYETDFTYDESGDMTSLTKKDYDGSVLYKQRFELSDDGLEAKRYLGSEKYPTIIRYDTDHRMIYEGQYNKYGETESEKKYAYTSEGLLSNATETTGMDIAFSKSTYSFETIAHYGKLATTKTVQFADLLSEPYEPDGGAYCPDAGLYLTRYEEAVVGVSHPYPSNLNFYLLPS